jgi:hypothetical protein
VAGVLIAVVACCWGCGNQSAEGLPQTYEVRGVVMTAEGDKLAGGSIEFTPQQAGGQRFMGRINPDGSFTATTIAATGTAAGAPQGTYIAVVIPPMSNEATQQHQVQPIKIAEEFTVSPTGENVFTIRLPATGR